MRSGDAKPSICKCLLCGRPLEGFDHSRCNDAVELLACPEHIEEERREIEDAGTRCGERASESGTGETDHSVAKAEEGETAAELIPIETVRPFERFPLVPIGPDDPLWHCDDCCHCGCRRMPPELSGAFCMHCGHEYQRNDPEFWLDEEFPHSQAAHLKNCASYQEYHRETEAKLARLGAMTANADEETFSKLQSACYSKAIDDNYEAYMSAPEGSPERAAIVERIVAANAEDIAERKRRCDAHLERRKGD
jgi:hypothetical protein